MIGRDAWAMRFYSKVFEWYCMQQNVAQRYTYRRFSTSSGIRGVHIILPKGAPYSVISAWFTIGARNDPPEKQGLAHCFEHLLMERTQTYPNRIRRIQKLESHGIDTEACTSYDLSYYYHTQLHEEFDPSFDFFLDGMTHSRFSDEQLAQEKQIIKEEARENRADPRSYLWRLSSKALCPKSTFNTSFFGTRATLARISRDDIVQWYKTVYAPMNAVCIIVTDSSVLTEYIREKLEDAVSIKMRTQYQITPLELFNPPVPFLGKRQELPHATIAVNIKTTSLINVDDRIALSVLSHYLAGGWASRLLRRMRLDKQICYWVESSVWHYRDTGYLQILFSVHPSKIKQAIECVREELYSVKERTIPIQTLVENKRAYCSRIVKNYCTPLDVLEWVGWEETLLGEHVSFIDWLRRVSCITAKDIQHVAQKYIKDENISVVCIGSAHAIDVAREARYQGFR